MPLFTASVSDKTGQIFSLEENLANERRSIEEYLSDMSGLLKKSYSVTLHGYIYQPMAFEKSSPAAQARGCASFIKLYFSALNFRDAAALAERLAPLHRKGAS